MNTIDMHCDTLMVLGMKKGEEADLYQDSLGSVDIVRLQKENAIAQFFAIFILSKEGYEYFKKEPMTNEEYYRICHKVWENTLQRYPAVVGAVRNRQDLEQNIKDKKVSLILSMEDGVMVDGKMERLREFYDSGVRALNLTWNFENCFGYPNSRDAGIMNKGLKDFGKEAVTVMEELGMIIDVSHLSDGGFWDICQLSKKPFIASHSNARAVCNHPRNLTDEMLKALANKGGVAGLNLGPEFLRTDNPNHESSIEDMVRMCQYIRNVAGIDVMGIGTDFDGISGKLDIDSSEKISLLYDALRKNGFTEEEIEKISYKNVLRVLRDCL